MDSRSTIKSKIKKLLIDAETDAESRVYTNRFIPIDDQEDEDAAVERLPAILIYVGSETIQDRDVCTQVRVAKVFIDCVVKGLFSDSDLDTLSGQVENALALSGDLDGTIEELKLIEGNLGGDEQIERSIILWRLTYEARYFASYPTGETMVNLHDVDETLDHNEHLQRDLIEVEHDQDEEEQEGN